MGEDIWTMSRNQVFAQAEFLSFAEILQAANIFHYIVIIL